jgi:hypothetical protein
MAEYLLGLCRLRDDDSFNYWPGAAVASARRHLARVFGTILSRPKITNKNN